MIWTLFALMGCSDDILYNSLFDGPSTADIMMPDENDVFDDAIGFVSNMRSGIITPLDLKHETALSDSKAAPFLRPRGVATGANRVLRNVVAIATQPGSIDVFAIDSRHGQLLRAPYITGTDTAPITINPILSTPEKPDEITVVGLKANSGRTTTETWTLTFEETDWLVSGSRSGVQHNRAVGNELYQSDQMEIELTIEGNPTSGDTIQFTTDTGVEEFQLPGDPTFLAQSPIDQRLVIGIAGDAQSILRMMDPIVGDVQDIEMPENTQPWAIEWGPNGELLIADAKANQLLKWDDTNSTWVEESAPVRIHDMARVTGKDYDTLYVASAGDGRVEAYDLIENTWLDLNPEDENTTGLVFPSPVTGLSATKTAVALQTESLWGARDKDNVVVVSLFGGEIQMIEGANGCLATNVEGPGILDSSLIGEPGITFIDTGPQSNPSFVENPDNGQQITANRCGGRLKTEEWTVRYDALEETWLVEGSISGLQKARVQMNVRYETDQGEMSFTLVDGPFPPSDGDSFYFQTVSNVLTISELLNNQSVEPLELPGEPIAFDYLAGPSDGGWDVDRTRAFALLPIVNSDIVLRLRLESWTVEVVWN